MGEMTGTSRDKKLCASGQWLLVLVIVLFFLVACQVLPAEAVPLNLGLGDLINVDVDLAEGGGLLDVTADVDTGAVLPEADTGISVGLGVGGSSLLEAGANMQTGLPGGEESGGAGLSASLAAVNARSSSLVDVSASLDADLTELPIVESVLPNTGLSANLDAGAGLGADGLNVGVDTSADIGLQTNLLTSGLLTDTVLDAGLDLGLNDEGLDLGLEAGADLGAAVESPLVDVAVDTVLDAGLDLGLGDGLDVSLDAGVDLGGEVGSPLGIGVSTDTGLDAALDLGLGDEGLDVGLNADLRMDGGAGSGAHLDGETELTETVSEKGSETCNDGETYNSENSGSVPLSDESRQPDEKCFGDKSEKQTRDNDRDRDKSGIVYSPGEKPEILLDSDLNGLCVNINSLFCNKANLAPAVPAGHDNAHRSPAIPCPPIPNTSATTAAGSITVALSLASGSKGWAVLADGLAAVPPLPSGWLPDAARCQYPLPGISPSALPG
ncbi:MAG: hypothetical protein ACOYU7_03205 [Bacillota bacterium]